MRCSNKGTVRKIYPACKMHSQPGLPAVGRKIARLAPWLGHTTDELPEILRFSLQVSHQVTVLSAPTIHAKDLVNAGTVASYISIATKSWVPAKHVDGATEGSIARSDGLQTSLGTSLEVSAIFLCQIYTSARNINESAQRTRGLQKTD